MAKILGLPIADFSFVEISSELWEELPDHFRNLGSGIAFGSKKVAGVNWLERFNAQDISEDLQRKLIAFDLWIKNMDRTLNNPNLLYQAQNKTLVIIDHNQAFDPQFNLDDFLETHIFREVFAHYNDLINRIEVESVFSNALAHLDDICNNLPQSWYWINPEEDISSSYDFKYMRETLERVNKPGELWRIK